MLNRIFVPGSAATVGGLALSQTVGYGTLFYSFSIMSGEFISAFGWSRSFVFAVFSAGLLANGLAAPMIGNLFDRIGARLPMTVGSLLAGIGLVAMGLVSGKASFTAAGVFVQLVCALVLYEAAFIAMTQVAGTKARLGITQITLVAGFASTIFWPLTVWLLEWLEWRQVYFVLAVTELVICTPIHWFVLPDRRRITTAPSKPQFARDVPESGRAAPPGAMLLLGISFCGAAIAITATQLHLPGILSTLGYEAGMAAMIGALIGPFQVGARLIEMIFGRHRTPLFSGIASTALIAGGLTVLLFAGLSTAAAICFAVFYGAGQGLTYIVRGAVPLHLFGPAGYGRITGRLNSVRQILSALAPFGFAWCVDRLGEIEAIVVLIASAALSLGALLVLSFLAAWRHGARI